MKDPSSRLMCWRIKFEEILHNFHNSLQFNHQGINKTLRKILLHYYFGKKPNYFGMKMLEYISKYIKF